MSDEVSNAQLLVVLTNISGQVGEVKGKVDLYGEALKMQAVRLSGLETREAKQAGAARVWGMVGAGIGSVLSLIGGALFNWWLKHRV
jgi:hypothetical protein